MGEESKLEDVLSYWFQESGSQRRWFPTGEEQKAIDAFIFDRFSTLFFEELERVPSLKDEEEEEEDKKSVRARIILLDQFSRHIFRHISEPKDSDFRRKADEKALQLSLRMIQQREDWDRGISVAGFIFAVMPLRHSHSLSLYRQLQTLIGRRAAHLAEEEQLLSKFRRQTLRRLEELEDHAKVDAAGTILAHEAMTVSDDDMTSSPLFIATKAFLARRLTASTVFISLSGGVDSMVLARILVRLRDEKRSNESGNKLIQSVVALHIDYANRPESAAEAAFVRSWCEGFGIEWEVRVVVEVTRGVTARDEYERVAREARYSFYRDAIASKGGFKEENSSGSGVMFGHHLGDVQENVLSNVMRGASPLSLSGMEEVSVVHNVTIWRPLLRFSKDAIFEFAHTYGVPYLLDTTPSWSTRGKLRNRLVPLLVDMYGAGCLANLSSLAAASDDHRNMVDQALYEPFLASVRTLPCGLAVNILPYISRPLCFWNEALRRLMHSLGMSMVRQSSVTNFVDYIQRRYSGRILEEHYKEEESAVIWLELRKGFFTCIRSSGELYIFREKVLITPTVVDQSLFSLPLGCSSSEQTYKIGSWHVSIITMREGKLSDNNNEDDDDDEYCIGANAFEDILGGSFSYQIHPRPGVNALCLLGSGLQAPFIYSSIKSKKKTGGKVDDSKVVFRALDAKLKSALPLLIEARESICGDLRSPSSVLLQYTCRIEA